MTKIFIMLIAVFILLTANLVLAILQLIEMIKDRKN